MTNKVVDAAYYSGMNFSWNLNLFNGPKFIIKCGNCSYVWKHRIPLINYPVLACPHCNILNRLNLVLS